MLPYLHLGSFNLPTFGLMLWLAAVAGAFIVDRAFKRAGISADAVGMVAVAVVAGIVGAKLWHVADTPSEFQEMGWRVLWDNAGFAWYGGLIFGISALVIQGRRAKIGALRMLDLCAPAAAIGYGIGRIGCFLSGDGDYGIDIQPVHVFGTTIHPWGTSFPHGLVPVLKSAPCRTEKLIFRQLGQSCPGVEYMSLSLEDQMNRCRIWRGGDTAV